MFVVNLKNITNENPKVMILKINDNKLFLEYSDEKFNKIIELSDIIEFNAILFISQEDFITPHFVSFTEIHIKQKNEPEIIFKQEDYSSRKYLPGFFSFFYKLLGYNKIPNLSYSICNNTKYNHINKIIESDIQYFIKNKKHLPIFKRVYIEFINGNMIVKLWVFIQFFLLILLSSSLIFLFFCFIKIS